MSFGHGGDDDERRGPEVYVVCGKSTDTIRANHRLPHLQRR